VGKVYSLDEVFTDPQVLHCKKVIEVKHLTQGKVKQVGFAIKLSDTPSEAKSFPPLPGEHTDEILKRLGYTGQKINELHWGAVVA
jgi:crotonobetainyl-CoA:carnitine CoA-transferase CaiB-like acyl-CoA transferase